VIGIPGADLFEGTGDVYAFEAGEWSSAGTILVEAGGLDAITGAEMRCDESGEIAGFTCSDVDLVSFLPTDGIGGERGSFTNDVWGWTDPDTGVEYAIVGRNDATTFISLADPTAPVYVGELPLTEGSVPNLWRDMKVYADHVFIVSDGAGEHGMQIFDLTRLRDVERAPVTFEADARYDGIFSAHNVVINEETGFAYIVGSSMGGTTCGGGLHMVDIRDPLNPTFAGCYSDPTTGMAGTGFVHDAQCLVYRGPDAQHQGRELCLGANETALSIVDVTDKANPVSLATIGYPNSAYVHQGWISDDQRYFFTNDEGDELAGVATKTRTLVWDIEDLDDPVLVTEHFGTTEATDHNLYVRGQLMYQSNYVSGLRVLDVSDPANPVEVGYFDTVPWGTDAPGFAGSWSNYPFFRSGVIVVSSMREGVFFLKARPRRVS
jgi:choice-of-anchor B domain-containing protein